MASLLFGVEPTDPVTFAAVALALALAAVAAYFPGRKATGVDPMVAFRADWGAYRLERILSYSACDPIQNQITSPSDKNPSAR